MSSVFTFPFTPIAHSGAASPPSPPTPAYTQWTADQQQGSRSPADSSPSGVFSLCLPLPAPHRSPSHLLADAEKQRTRRRSSGSRPGSPAAHTSRSLSNN